MEAVKAERTPRSSNVVMETPIASENLRNIPVCGSPLRANCETACQADDGELLCGVKKATSLAASPVHSVSFVGGFRKRKVMICFLINLLKMKETTPPRANITMMAIMVQWRPTNTTGSSMLATISTMLNTTPKPINTLSGLMMYWYL